MKVEVSRQQPSYIQILNGCKEGVSPNPPCGQDTGTGHLKVRSSS